MFTSYENAIGSLKKWLERHGCSASCTVGNTSNLFNLDVTSILRSAGPQCCHF